MPRRPTHYVGATKRLALRDALDLGPRWAIQPKKDGCYARVYLNGDGRIAKVFLRNGSEAPAHLTTHMMGAIVGNPHAELVGEIEAMTEQAERLAKLRPRRIWLFDCLHDGAQNLVRAPYHERRSALHRMHAAIQCSHPADDHRPKPWRRYRDAVLPGWKLCPVVEQVPSAHAQRAWEDWVVGPDDGDEGLVAVNLDAPAGARSAKQKIRPWHSIDCAVHSVGPRAIVCMWNGHPFAVGLGKRHYVEVGNVVEVRIAGWYERGVTPKFPSLVRVRRDLLI